MSLIYLYKNKPIGKSSIGYITCVNSVPLPPKPNQPVFLSETYEYGTAYAPAWCHALCLVDLGNVRKDQSEDPATFYPDPLVLTFKETLKG